MRCNLYYKNKKRKTCDLRKITEDMDSIKESVTGSFKDQQLITSSTPPAAASSRPGETSMVGFEDYLIQLMDMLTCSQQSHLQVIPIIGMGGVGKTTLTRNAFENLLVKNHFDVCAWATISQDYSMRDILLQLLSIHEDRKKLVALDENQLGEKLRKYLFSRRYLIVLDDVWSIEVWDKIKYFFPNNDNGSRIVLTSRLLDISLHFKSPFLTIKLLDEDRSWNLFCQASFGKESCPAELEEVGKKICKNCKGLPLSIVVIGGFLQKSSKAQEYWEGVASDTHSILSSEGDNQCMNILCLSYNHLPARLKPCFLYMGVFAEDSEILVSGLIKLWVGEGFLKPNDARSLEEVGEGYFKDLVDRNLILVNRRGSNGKMVGCKVHDLIRELCLRVGEKEKFICVMKGVGTNRERRIVSHDENVACVLESAVRSLICKGHTRFKFRLMRVLSAVGEVLDRGYLDDILRCVNLRCLNLKFVPELLTSHPSIYLPNKISLLWNLQTVIINGCYSEIIAPPEIWEMVQLRHLQVPNLYVPDPVPNDRVALVLPNLQTLGKAKNFRFSEEVCKRIPNVKKLRLSYKWEQRCDGASYYCPQNVGRFHKLVSLSLEFEFRNWRPMVLNMKLPSSLKKLYIQGGNLYWEDLHMIGSLPNLEVVKLMAFSMIGSEWNPVEGEFQSLKFLQILCCFELTKWNAESIHFPVLEKLVLGRLENLDEIPWGIGEIPTLRIISLFECSLQTNFSAVKILEEQESFGNDDLQVEVRFHIDNRIGTERFREMMEEDGFTSNNLHIKSVHRHYKKTDW